MCITELQLLHNLYSNVMVLLQNERPNFPTNWLKHINKGLTGGGGGGLMDGGLITNSGFQKAHLLERGA